MAGHPPGAPPPPSMMPPPPPPPPPPGGWAPAKPNSGKAIASLVCGLAGPVAAFFCPPLGVAVLVGLVLGIIGIVETGKNGRRSGRGMAIAGTIISTASVGFTIAVIVFFVTMAKVGDEENLERRQERLTQDQTLLIQRLQEYAVANEDSLGPGGPVLARGQSTLPAGTARANGGAPQTGLVVSEALNISHLVDEDELKFGGRGRGGNFRWELTINGQLSATLRARDWEGDVIREVEIRDASRGLFDQTIP